MNISLDIFSDTICPWCYIGKKRLENSIKNFPNIEFKITWRPFQLNPEMSQFGMDRQEYLSNKFGGIEQAQEVYLNIQNEGLKEEIKFEFSKIQITPNSFNSHRLLAYAHSKGKQTELIEELFQAYFIKGIDIGDPKQLLNIAEQNDFNSDEVKKYLSDDLNIKPLANEQIQAQQMGIESVPTFIINKKIVVKGAQNTHQLNLIFTKISQSIN